MNALETFYIGLTLPERWRKKLEETAKLYASPGKEAKIQDAVRVAVAAMFFPEECHLEKQKTEA